MTNEQFDYYSSSLSTWIKNVIHTQDKSEIQAIRSLWDNESWESIVKKYRIDGSTWIVWWNDGVRAYFKLDQD